MNALQDALESLGGAAEEASQGNDKASNAYMKDARTYAAVASAEALTRIAEVLEAMLAKQNAGDDETWADGYNRGVDDGLAARDPFDAVCADTDSLRERWEPVTVEHIMEHSFVDDRGRCLYFDDSRMVIEKDYSENYESIQLPDGYALCRLVPGTEAAE